MVSKWNWIYRLVTRRLWFRSTLISLLAVVSALLAIVLGPYIPYDISASIGAEAVDNILTIIASSMLAVTTFSLSTMVAAYSAATSNVTPRATKLLLQDPTSQNVLSTFVGSFLYSLVAIITLSMNAYGERGRVILFVVTIFVVLLIVATLLRWIDYLTRLGRVGDTTEVVEKATADALRSRRRQPYLGGVHLAGEKDIPADAVAIPAPFIGYVQHIDLAKLQEIAQSQNVAIYLLALPGTFVDPRHPLARIASDDGKVHEAIAAAYSLARERSFDQDPRFGLSVLAEIAQRALSPAVNDPGTAIDVIGRTVRLLAIWDEPEEREPVRFPAVHVASVRLSDLFDDAYSPIARDGAGIAEVQVRLQKAFAALSALDDPRFRIEAARHSDIALRRAEAALTLKEDIEAVRAAARGVAGTLTA
ncbi:DUF2254 domain-containing protein [Aliihoeflea sp. 40Bstr573]|uniref:DUF2254 domain-containing protein n=1 Tax=Aliihoeflea sp. 40Bstr573 TaxID=2696467 RepID=UPI00209478D7|nr:DUF2254 domain-containing protein [Aliihoeflea sp. 40Bstr573]MCO6387735.1 DUF2254 domain-containing protein [Aliihoeflea sp. 40Bstr573]